MARLPAPGSDRGNWGDILNEFLLVEHSTDGSLKQTEYISDAKEKANAAIRSINSLTPTNGALALTANDVQAEPVNLSNDTKDLIDTKITELTAKERHASGVYIYGIDWTYDDDTDHGALITTAINEITDNGGGRLIVPAGNYTLTSPIEPLEAKGVTLSGTVPGMQFGSSTHAGTTFISNFDGDVLKGYWENSEFYGFRIDANNRGAAISGDFSKMMMQRLEISNYNGYGINVCTGEYTGDTTSYLLRIQDCSINAENGYGIGIYVSYRATDAWIVGNNIGSTNTNIYIEGGTIRILHNHLNGVAGGGPENNIRIPSSSGAYLIADNICEHARKEAILVERPSWESGVARMNMTITNNLMRDAGWNDPGNYSMIRIKGNTTTDSSAKMSNIGIVGNTMYDQHESLLHAVELDHVSYSTLTGNTWQASHTETDPLKEISCTNVDVVANGGDNTILVV